MKTKGTVQAPEAGSKRWTRPQLERMGTITDVAIQKNPSNFQGNFT